MQPPGQQRLTPRPRSVYWIASLTLAGVLLYFSLRGIEWLRVWSILLHAKLTGVALAMALISGALFLRALRWRILLSSGTYVPIPMAFWATSAGYLGNSVLPARAGELVRTVMISRQSGMSKAFVLVTALSERVVDAIVLITISAVVLLTLPARPGWLADAAKPFAALGLCGAAMIALAPALESFWLKVLAGMHIPQGLQHRLQQALRQGLQGLRTFHEHGRLLRFLAFTAIIWCADGATTVVGARAIGIKIGFPLAFLLLAGLGLGSALPSTPGYVGIYQFVAVSVLVPFGLTRNDAIAYILLFQAMNFAVLLFWGVFGLAQGGRPAIAKAGDSATV